jgi:hypothetical protein
MSLISTLMSPSDSFYFRFILFLRFGFQVVQFESWFRYLESCLKPFLGSDCVFCVGWETSVQVVKYLLESQWSVLICWLLFTFVLDQNIGPFVVDIEVHATWLVFVLEHFHWTDSHLCDLLFASAWHLWLRHHLWELLSLLCRDLLR